MNVSEALFPVFFSIIEHWELSFMTKIRLMNLRLCRKRNGKRKTDWIRTTEVFRLFFNFSLGMILIRLSTYHLPKTIIIQFFVNMTALAFKAYA